MGTWGYKLYQDDVAQDVRDDFMDMLRRGTSSEEAVKQLIDDFEQGPENLDTHIFWFALADTMWNLGVLQEEVKEQALLYLDAKTDLARWQEENPKAAPHRKIVLNDLRDKLNSPQPPKKKLSQYRIYHCTWQIGDVYAYPLDSEYAKEKGLYGRYFLFYKIDETTVHPGHTVPVVYVKITDEDGTLPKTTEELDKLAFVKLGLRTPEDQMTQKGKAGYRRLIEENGWLADYRLELYNTSKRIIPKKLVYIGRFGPITYPEKEYINDSPYAYLSYTGFQWKWFDKSIMDRYFAIAAKAKRYN